MVDTDKSWSLSGWLISWLIIVHDFPIPFSHTGWSMYQCQWLRGSLIVEVAIANIMSWRSQPCCISGEWLVMVNLWVAMAVPKGATEVLKVCYQTIWELITSRLMTKYGSHWTAVVNMVRIAGWSMMMVDEHQCCMTHGQEKFGSKTSKLPGREVLMLDL